MTHRHIADESDAPQKCVEIDPHVCLMPLTGGGEGITDVDDNPVPEYFAGFLIGHDRDGFDVRCEGFVSVHPSGRNRWEMTGTLEGGDLTLKPSIRCVTGSASAAECGFHGYVTNGKWVPAP